VVSKDVGASAGHGFIGDAAEKPVVLHCTMHAQTGRMTGLFEFANSQLWLPTYGRFFCALRQQLSGIRGSNQSVVRILIASGLA
jgi:hypothetical protein